MPPIDAGRDVAVGAAQLACVLAEPDQHRLQVLEVEEREPLLVGDPEGDVEHPLLGVGELHQPGEEQAAPSR